VTYSVNKRQSAGFLLCATAICLGVLGTGAASGAASLPGSLVPVYAIDFTGDTAGGQPAIEPYFDDKTSTRFEALDTGVDNGDALVVSDSLADLSGRSLKFVEAGTGDFKPWVGANLPDISSGTVRFSWNSAMVNIEPGKSRNLLTFWLYGTKGQEKDASLLVALSYAIDGSSTSFGLQGIGGQTGRGSWTLSKSDRFTVTVDMDAGTLTIKADDTTLVDRNLGGDRITSLTGFRFADASSIGGGDVQFTAGINNVVVVATKSAIP